MEAVVRKWGNSPAIRIPTAILKETGFSLNQQVEITAAKVGSSLPGQRDGDTHLNNYWLV
jgi:antitoxin component of MazEF toxin-antitoxin module